MKNEEIGIVSDYSFGREDHGIMTLMLQIDFRGSSQGFGGYFLDEPVYNGDKFVRRKGTEFGMEFVMKILDVFGVDDLNEIKGERIIAVREDSGWNARIIGLKSVPPDEERSFFPKKDLVDYLKDGV